MGSVQFEQGTSELHRSSSSYKKKTCFLTGPIPFGRNLAPWPSPVVGVQAQWMPSAEVHRSISSGVSRTSKVIECQIPWTVFYAERLWQTARVSEQLRSSSTPQTYRFRRDRPPLSRMQIVKQPHSSSSVTLSTIMLLYYVWGLHQGPSVLKYVICMYIYIYICIYVFIYIYIYILI